MDFENMSENEIWALTTSGDDQSRLDAFIAIIQRFANQNRHADIIAPAGIAIDLSKQLDDQVNEAELSYTLGVALYRLDREEEALVSLQTATDLYRVNASEAYLADSLKLQADCLESLGRHDEAVEAWRSAIALYSENDRETSAGICCLDLGESLGRQERQQDALQRFNEALNYFESCGDLIGSGRAHDRMAAALIDLGHVDDALSHLRESLNIFEFMQDASRLAYARYRLGWTLVTRARYWEAIPLLELASDWYKSEHKYVSAANCDTQIAHAFMEIGREDDALDIYRRIRSVYQGAGEYSDALIADVNAARRLKSTDLDGAIELLRKVVEKTTELNFGWLRRAAILRLAECLYESSESESSAEAMAVLNQLDLSEIGDNRPERARAQIIRGWVLLDLNDRDGAKSCASQVIEYADFDSFEFEAAQAFELLSLLTRDEGHEASADEYLTKAIALFLAAGYDQRARSLSSRFLPSSKLAASDHLQNKDESPHEQ